MAPRNNDPSTSCKRNYPTEETDIRDLLPCLLHKKHKVVKLVKSQIRNIRKEGFICDLPQYETEEVLTMRAFEPSERLDECYEGRKEPCEGKGGQEGKGERGERKGERGERQGERGEGRGGPITERRAPFLASPGGEGAPAATGGGRSRRSLCCYLTLLLLEFLFLVVLMVYISAGPLSNTIAHTPVPPGSFVRTEEPCFLEKKYLLRWSRPELLE